MKIRHLLFVCFTICISSSHAQSIYPGIGYPSSSNSTQLYFGYAGGSFAGISHLKNLTPRTAALVGLTYFNPSIVRNSNELYTTSQSSYMLHAEWRYYLTPKDNKLTAFTFGALNYGFANSPFNQRQGFNLGIEAGAEIRYKIAENVFFYARTSIYRQNYNNSPNPYYSPYSIY